MAMWLGKWPAPIDSCSHRLFEAASVDGKNQATRKPTKSNMDYATRKPTNPKIQNIETYDFKLTMEIRP